MSLKAIDDGKVPNEDLARKLHGNLTVIFYFVYFLNTCALLLSYKYLRITKLYYYSCILIHGIEVFMPRYEEANLSR